LILVGIAAREWHNFCIATALLGAAFAGVCYINVIAAKASYWLFMVGIEAREWHDFCTATAFLGAAFAGSC
jgi:hypothetical protein